MAYRSRSYSTDVERKASAMKHNPEKEQEARDWIESVLGRGSFPQGTFQQALQDGILLCELINVLQPGSVKKIHTGSMKFKMMENISHFLKSCEAYGVTKTDLFQTVDLNEGRNIPQVINTILALARASQKPTNSQMSSSQSYGSRHQDDLYRHVQQSDYDQQSRGYHQQTHGYDDQQTHTSHDPSTYTNELENDQQTQHVADHDQQAHEDNHEADQQSHEGDHEAADQDTSNVSAVEED